MGVPMLAGGMFSESAMLVRIGAWALFCGVALSTLDTALVVAPALQRRPARRAVA
jgi:hypothetical protein